MHILIVEDDAFYMDILARHVLSWGHDVTRAATGWDALQKAAALPFDLVLMDVFLPDMTAMDLIPRLRPSQADPPIVTLTGQNSRELERLLREMGVAYYMAKPVSAPELQMVVDHLARGRVRPAAPEQPTVPVPA